MSQEQPPFGLPGPILAEIQRRPRSRIKFNDPPSVELSGTLSPISGYSIVAEEKRSTFKPNQPVGFERIM